MNMTIEEYRARLYAALSGYDRNEVDQAVNYYIELIEDAEDQGAQMAKLGSPEQLAQRIIKENGWVGAQYTGGFGTNNYNSNYDYTNSAAPGKKGIGGRITALVLTFPFWLTVFILLITLLIVVWAVFISIPIAGIAAAIESVRWIGKYFGYALPVLFAGIGMAGLTILLYAPVRKASSSIFKGVTGFSRFLFGNTDKEDSFDVKKAKTYFSKSALIIGALLTVVGAGISTPLFAKASSNPEKFVKAMGLEDYEYQFNDILDSINVKIENSANLEVLPSDNGKMYLKAQNIKPDKLNITNSQIVYENFNSNGNTTWFSFGNIGDINAKFYLYLPEKEYTSVVLDSSLGNINVNKLTAGQISVVCNCGNEKLTDVKQTKAEEAFSVTNDLGNITLENCSAASKNAQIIQKCGNVTVKSLTADTLNAENDLGNITIEKMTADTVNCKNDSGNIKIKDSTINKLLDCKLELGNADIELNGTDYNVAAESDLGNVKINGQKITEAPTGGSIPIKVSNNCGNVTVDFK